ncbi:alpha/beta fold hydrolase [Anthocerotibacter panamensis]|uniref:alpha/beta fold hydrolase n=1 Tax=Anthocerotibacter panamensis TaxID=2857077 RepID=UPI001FD98A3F|nr:alpha/beta hydrolase [Anthocerotibacter panamensis]
MVATKPEGFTRETLVTPVGRLNYYCNEGEYSKTLVFLHGFGGGSSSFEWSLVYPHFAQEYRVLAPDLLGWGYSEHLARDYQPEDYLHSIRAFLEKTCPQPAIVVASSVVAAWMVRLAVEHPQRFERLVLLCPTGLADFGRPYFNPFFQLVTAIPGLNGLFYTLGIANRANIRSFLENVLFAESSRVTEQMVEAYYTAATQPQAEYSAFSFLKGNLSFDLAPWMPRLQTPTAILWGESANFASPALGRRLARLSPQVKTFAVVPDSGTTPQLEQPEATAHHIREALSKLV